MQDLENNQEQINISNVTGEVLFVGAIYNDPELIISYNRLINSEVDFTDEVTKFLYDMAVLIYDTYTQEFTENSVNTFMIQDDERKSKYRAFGGWKTIQKFRQLSTDGDMNSYYGILKKYSILREYDKAGFNVSKIMAHKDFAKFDAQTIIKLMTAKLSKVNTKVLVDRTSSDLTSSMTSKVRSYLANPCIGIPYPYPMINASIKGVQKGTMMAIGLQSNGGKSRQEVFIMLYLALINNVKVLILENEMSEQAIFNCMVTTIVNSKEIQDKYGWKLTLTESEITLGKYKNSKGNYITRKENETLEEYTQRVETESEDFRTLMQITNYVETKLHDLIFIKDVGSDYTDDTLINEIRKHNRIYGIEYISYGTLKNPEEKWELLKKTTTRLSETIKELKCFLLVMAQLTDETTYTDALDLSSSNIAGSKQIKHILDTLFLSKEIEFSDWYKYEYCYYNQDYGEPSWKNLHSDKKLYSVITDKNRNGAKPKVLFEVDLDLNTWKELGILRRKEMVTKQPKKK